MAEMIVYKMETDSADKEMYFLMGSDRQKLWK